MIAIWEFMVGLAIGLPASIWLYRQVPLLLIASSTILFGFLFSAGIGCFYLWFSKSERQKARNAYMKVAHGS